MRWRDVGHVSCARRQVTRADSRSTGRPDYRPWCVGVVGGAQACCEIRKAGCPCPEPFSHLWKSF